MTRPTTSLPPPAASSAAASHRPHHHHHHPAQQQLSWLLTLTLLLVLTFGAAPVAAQSSTTTPSLDSLSPCSVNCLIGSIPVTNCTVLDIACQCASEKLATTVTDCMLANCTMQDSLDLSRFTAGQCNFPHDSQQTNVVVFLAVLYTVAVSFVLLRVWSKFQTNMFSLEDYSIVASVVIASGSLVASLYMAHMGFGSHVYDLQNGALTQILKMFYVGEILYIASLALIKISLVLMYLRIFWAYQPFQWACYCVLGFIIGPSIIITLVTVFSCDPIAFFWDRDLPNGHCLDVTSLAYANSAFAMAQDIVLILLPIFMLWKLNMSRKKKFFIALMFGVGSVGLVATIIRLQTLHVFGNLQDPTFDYIPVVYWTVAELAAGLIASCLPAIRKLLERFSGVFMLSAHHRSDGGSGGAIRMERQRRPTADSSRWKEEVEMVGALSGSSRYKLESRDGKSVFSQGTTVVEPPLHGHGGDYDDDPERFEQWQGWGARMGGSGGNGMV